MSNLVLTGVVTGQNGPYFVVEVTTPDVPPHLQTHNLMAQQMKGAKVGDRVELRYYASGTYGYWFVSHVFTD